MVCELGTGAPFVHRVTTLLKSGERVPHIAATGSNQLYALDCEYLLDHQNLRVELSMRGALPGIGAVTGSVKVRLHASC